MGKIEPKTQMIQSLNDCLRNMTALAENLRDALESEGFDHEIPNKHYNESYIAMAQAQAFLRAETGNFGEMSKIEIIKSLGSEICPMCSRKKVYKRSFCMDCFRKLSPRMQERLYLPFGKGYCSAFRDALRQLSGSDDGRKNSY